MTTGTITHFDPSRGTGTVTCASGGRFPFTARNARLSPGDRVTFRATGGITGLYALGVRHVGATARSANARLAFLRRSLALSRPMLAVR